MSEAKSHYLRPLFFRPFSVLRLQAASKSGSAASFEILLQNASGAGLTRAFRFRALTLPIPFSALVLAAK